MVTPLDLPMEQMMLQVGTSNKEFVMVEDASEDELRKLTRL